MDHQKIGRLVRKAAEGDREAFASLYESLFDSFYYSALKILRSPEDAADVVQDVMVELYHHLDKLTNPEAFVAYTNRKIYGKSVDLLRRQQRWSFSEELNLPEEAETSDDFLPESYVFTREQRSQVLAAIDELSDNLRIIVMMYYYQQMTVAEIARVLDLQENAVNTRLSRARGALKRRLMRDRDREKVSTASMLAMTLVFKEEAATLAASGAKGAIWERVCQTVGLPALPLPSVSASAASAAGGSAIGIKAIAIAATVAITAGGGFWLVNEIAKPASLPMVQTEVPEERLPVDLPVITEPFEQEVNAPAQIYPSEEEAGESGEQIAPPSSLPIVENGAQTTSGEEPMVEIEEIPTAEATPVSPEAPLPSITISATTLSYPLDTVLTAERILADSGATALHTMVSMTVKGLNRVTTYIAGTYYVAITLPPEEAASPNQRVVCLVIGDGGQEVWEEPEPLTALGQSTKEAEEDYTLFWNSRFSVEAGVLTDADVLTQAVYPQVENRLGTSLSLPIELTCPNFSPPGGAGTYSYELLMEYALEDVTHTATLDVTVEVSDGRPPTLSVGQSRVTLPMGSEMSLSGLISLAKCSATDDSGVSPVLSAAVLFGDTIDWSCPGEYAVEVTAQDSRGNETKKGFVLIITSN